MLQNLASQAALPARPLRTRLRNDENDTTDNAGTEPRPRLSLRREALKALAARSRIRAGCANTCGGTCPGSCGPTREGCIDTKA